MKLIKSLGMGASAAILLAGTAAFGANLVRVPTLGGTDSNAFDINEQGQVVGQASLFGDTYAHAYIWDSNGMQDLGAVAPNNNSGAYAINNNGEVVGWSDNDAAPRTAMYWNGSQVTDLGREMSAVGSSVAWDINDRGQVVGQAALAPGFAKGFLWDAGMGGVSVGTLDFYQGGTNQGINEQGLIVGSSFFFGDPDDAHLAIPDDQGRYTSIQIGPPGFGFSFATAINESNMISGHAPTDDGHWNAVVWTPPAMPGDEHGAGGATMTPLGTLPNLEYSEGLDINDDGVVVGYSWDADFGMDPRAWVYMNDQMIDLNDFLPQVQGDFVQLLQATAINNKGDIVGIGLTNDGALAGYVLSGVVPTPASLSLLAVSGIAMIRRRR